MRKFSVLFGFLSLCTSVAWAQPLIGRNGIVSSASFAPALSVGGAIAQGSIFSIFGSALGPAVSPPLTSFPLAATLGGVSVKVIAGSTSLDAFPVYVSPTLINAIMPSNAPLGKVSVQVTFNGTKSNLAPVTIAANAPGIYTATGAGTGPGILQNFSPQGVPTNSTRLAATPGQTAVLWLTGLGPITGADNQAPPVGNLSFPVELWIGGKAVTNIQYSGRTPCCAGVDEIVFSLPADAPIGCYVPVTMRVAGKAVSNTVTIAVDSRNGACTDTISGAYTKGGKFGTTALIRRQIRVDDATPPDLVVDVGMAGFSQEAGSEFSFNSITSLPPAGSCMVYFGTGDFTNADVPFATAGKALLAGTVTVKGPTNTITLFQGIANGASEHLNLLGSTGMLPPTAPGPFLSAGAFTIAGSGGADVGPFSVAVTVPNTNVSWTNRDQLTTADRTQSLTFNWTGTSFLVAPEGVNYDAPTNSSAAFRCIAPAGATSFTVPSWVLANFAPTRTDPNGSASFLGLASATAPVSFLATGLENTAAFYILQQSRKMTFK